MSDAKQVFKGWLAKVDKTLENVEFTSIRDLERIVGGTVGFYQVTFGRFRCDYLAVTLDGIIGDSFPKFPENSWTFRGADGEFQFTVWGPVVLLPTDFDKTKVPNE